MIFQFPLAPVIPLVEHTLRSRERAATFDQCFLAAFRRDGRDIEVGAGAHVSHADVDPAKVPPELHLFKDSGVYLMSNGRPGLREPDGKKHVTVHAVGHGENDFLGGDDFVIEIPVSWIQEAEKAGVSQFGIEVRERSVALRLPRRR